MTVTSSMSPSASLAKSKKNCAAARHTSAAQHSERSHAQVVMRKRPCGQCSSSGALTPREPYRCYCLACKRSANSLGSWFLCRLGFKSSSRNQHITISCGGPHTGATDWGGLVSGACISCAARGEGPHRGGSSDVALGGCRRSGRRLSSGGLAASSSRHLCARAVAHCACIKNPECLMNQNSRGLHYCSQHNGTGKASSLIQRSCFHSTVSPGLKWVSTLGYSSDNESGGGGLMQEHSMAP